jgi:UPF0042 nucleotide-binding protein
LTGQDAAVRGAIFADSRAATGFEHVLALLAVALPGYVAEGKRYVSIAIGCTGGRHRSVAIAEALGAGVQFPGADIHVRHRDIERA